MSLYPVRSPNHEIHSVSSLVYAGPTWRKCLESAGKYFPRKKHPRMAAVLGKVYRCIYIDGIIWDDMGLYGIIWDIIPANLLWDIDTYSIPTLYILYVYCSRSALLGLHICIIYIIWVHDEYNIFYL